MNKLNQKLPFLILAAALIAPLYGVRAEEPAAHEERTSQELNAIKEKRQELKKNIAQNRKALRETRKEARKIRREARHERRQERRANNKAHQ